MVYYLPVILTQSFGFSPRLALILAGVDFTSLMFWGSIITLFIDRWGRKPLMLFGSIGCGICFVICTIGLALGTQKTYAMAVSFIFGYHIFYVSHPALMHRRLRMLTCLLPRECLSWLSPSYFPPKSTLPE